MLFYLITLHVILMVICILMYRRYQYWATRFDRYYEEVEDADNALLWLTCIGYTCSVLPIVNLLAIGFMLIISSEDDWKAFKLDPTQKRWLHSFNVEWFKGVVTPAIAIKPSHNRVKECELAHPEDSLELYLALFLVIITVDYQLELKYRR